MTRYPKQGKGRRWTIKELDAIDKTWRGDTISDGDGLSGEVRVASDDTVTIRFKYAYKSDGKVSWHQCGTWPVRTLESIRAERDQARLQLRQGVDPSDKRKADRLQAQAQVQAVIAEAARNEAENLPVQAMVDAWLRDGVKRADDNAELRRSFDKDVPG